MKMRFRFWVLSAAVLLLVGAVGWFLVAKRIRGDAANETQPAPVAPVKTAALRRGSIERTLIAYGTAVTAPGGTRSLSLPFECRVVAVQANAGQAVKEGEALLQVEPSVDARLALDTARAAQGGAEATLKDAQSRFNAHLATNADLAAAQSAARDARLKLDSLQSRAPAAGGDVNSPSTGLVTTVSARPGSIVPAGSPLVEIAVEHRVEARLGIAPPDAAQIRAGQSVRLTAIDGQAGVKSAAWTGTVRVVGQSVDPVTRMVDGSVALDAPAEDGAPVLIGSYLRAEIVVDKKEALLAVRDSVLPDAEHPGQGTIYAIKADKAIKHGVGIGIDDGRHVELTGDTAGLSDGTPVVTEGVYELEDGMAVKIAEPEADRVKHPQE